jgi:hypothetical protein
VTVAAPAGTPSPGSGRRRRDRAGFSAGSAVLRGRGHADDAGSDSAACDRASDRARKGDRARMGPIPRGRAARRKRRGRGPGGPSATGGRAAPSPSARTRRGSPEPRIGRRGGRSGSRAGRARVSPGRSSTAGSTHGRLGGPSVRRPRVRADRQIAVGRPVDQPRPRRPAPRSRDCAAGGSPRRRPRRRDRAETFGGDGRTGSGGVSAVGAWASPAARRMRRRVCGGWFGDRPEDRGPRPGDARPLDRADQGLHGAGARRSAGACVSGGRPPDGRAVGRSRRRRRPAARRSRDPPPLAPSWRNGENAGALVRAPSPPGPRPPAEPRAPMVSEGKVVPCRCL